ncbi:MAG: ABC transporter ATP-binding protein/permease [Promicromonosporaceae bacterium]|nr:ABC transporter ATP-binding protein/permease [Promicromonosporaceae bacterium]
MPSDSSAVVAPHIAHDALDADTAHPGEPTPKPGKPTAAEKAKARADNRRNWRTLMGFLKPYRGRLLIGSLFAIIATVTGLWTPRIIEWVIGNLEASVFLGEDVSGALVTNVTIFAVLTIIYIVTVLLQWILLGNSAEHVVYDVRAALVARFLRGRVSEIRERSTADLVSRATADAPLLQVTVTLGFVSLVQAAVGVVGSIILMGVIDPLMLGITLGALVLLGITMALIMPKAGRERALAQTAVGHMSTELDGSMRALRTIKASRAEASHVEAVLDDAEKARKHTTATLITEVIGYEVGFGGMLLVTVFMLAFGAWRVQGGYLSIGALVAFVMYTQNFIMPLMQMADGFSTIQQGLAASNRIGEAMEIPLEEAEEATGVSDDELHDEASDPLIEFMKVSARYKQVEDDVIKQVSFTIPRRGHVAIVGESGAGKSTTVSLMMRFLSPRSGLILLDGVPYDQFTYSQVRERIAYVEQEPPVLPFSIRDNLEPVDLGLTDEQLYAALRAVDLDEEFSEFPDGLDHELVATTMTGSERQRLAVARALLAVADVLIIDDATSQIGGAAEKSIDRALAAFAKQGVVITIGNNLDTVRDADQVLLLEEGQLVAQGSHEDLEATSELYRSLVGR